MNRPLLRTFAVAIALLSVWASPVAAWTFDATWLLRALADVETAAGRTSELVVMMDDVEVTDEPLAVWLELTPMTGDEPATVLRGLLEAGDEPPTWRPPVGLFVRGATMMCLGAAGVAVRCDVIYQTSEIASALEWTPGLVVTGRYRLDDLPVADARVAVVPADLTWPRPFVMPLPEPLLKAGPETTPETGPESRSATAPRPVEEVEAASTVTASRLAAPLRRSVRTDDDGAFRLPPLAAGAYRLETILPDGRVHHSDAFDVPALQDARRTLGAFGDPPPVWDVGNFELDAGLIVAFDVFDPAGQPIADATVHGRQGDVLTGDVVFYEARTGADGTAVLGGFNVDQPVHVGCRAAGYQAYQVDHALVPVQVSCALIPRTEIVGAVLGPDEGPVAGVRVTLRAFAEAADARTTASPDRPTSDLDRVLLDAAGNIVVVPGRDPFGDETGALEDGALEDGALEDDSLGDGALEAEGLASVSRRLPTDDTRALGPIVVQKSTDDQGRFALKDLAPGHYRLDVTAPEHAPDHHEVVLDDAGTVYDLGTVRLLRGRRILGVVVASDTGAPVADAVVRVVEPSGTPAVTTDADGAFTLTSGGTGSMILEAHQADYARSRVTVSADDAASSAPIEVTLPPGGQILAVVWDAETGRACAGCTLRVQPGVMELTTDEAGEALSEVLTPGRYRVERAAIDHRGSSVVQQAGAEVRHARVRQGGVVPVWFGERRRTLMVQLTPTPTEPWYLSARGTSRTLRLAPEADGRYRLPQEAEEDWQLYLERHDPGSGFRSEVRVGVLDGPVPEDLGPAVQEVSMPLGQGVVMARVYRNGSPAPRQAVRLLALDDRTLIAGGGTNDEGHFSFAHLSPGVYALEIDAVPVRMVLIESGQVLDLGDVDLLAGGGSR